MFRSSFFLAAVLLLASSLRPQQPGFHFFDPKSLVEIQGTVQRIDLEETYGKRSRFLVLTVMSADRVPYRVEICPQWFLENDIAVGMKIRIHGSLLAETGENAYLIAQEISLQGERIALRDRRGFPLWSRQGSMEGGGSRKGPGRRGKR
ncbi:MAG: hypothetical protein MUC72_01040 [Acidobacteria bacterium]|jgi:hypothetical protein|nr:hypothetical protein [Acidobacteriota bacterium]